MPTSQQVGSVRAGARATGMNQSAQRTLPRSVTGPSIGAILALSAFSVAIIAGMYSGNSAVSVVGRALLAMIVCYPVGLGVGWVGRRVVHEHTTAHARANPLPQVESDHASTNNAQQNETDESFAR